MAQDNSLLESSTVRKQKYKDRRWTFFYCGLMMLFMGLLLLVSGSLILHHGDRISFLVWGGIGTTLGVSLLVLRFTKFHQPEMPQPDNAE